MQYINYFAKLLLEVVAMKNPIILVFAITGKPSEEKIFQQMQTLKNVGIEQVCIYPRSGCELTYLSDEWFEAVGSFITAAEKLEMYLWIYDDFNWPSGHAGGAVTENPKYRLRAITVTGEHAGEFSVRSQNSGSLFAEKFFPDLLCPDAVSDFIDRTHNQYYARFGKYFGSRILGFFTDEPAAAYCCNEDSVPYYDGIEEDYAALGGNFHKEMKNDVSEFCRKVSIIVAERFKNCYIKRLSDWCESHGVLLTGHLMSDDTPPLSTKQSGNLLSVLSAFSVPGIDEIETRLARPEYYSLFGDLEYAASKNGAMVELFALGPCDISYAKRRCVMFFAACFKADRFFTVCHLDLRGNTKICDYFVDMAPLQPDFDGVRLLSRDAKNAASLASKDFKPDVYIRYPTELCAKNLTNSPDPKFFTDIINALTQRQIAWKYIDNEQPNDAPVLEFTDDFGYCIGDLKTKDAATVCDLFHVTPAVTNTDGTLPVGIFVRKFEDGDLAVINLYGAEDTYIIEGKQVFLYEHGVYVKSLDKDSACNSTENAQITVTKVEHDRENIVRAMYLNAETMAKIHTDRERYVRFAVRRDTSLFIGENKIVCSQSGDIMPEGMRELYAVSDEILLKKGENTICSSDDFKYLPSVFVIGDFAAETKLADVFLKDRTVSYNIGDYFEDFGEVRFKLKAAIPKNARKLRIEGKNLFTRVFIENELIGEGICKPYDFEIPKKFQNREVHITVAQYSSIGPIFADTAFFDKESENVKWRGTPDTEKTLFGFDNIGWIF